MIATGGGEGSAGVPAPESTMSEPPPSGTAVTDLPALRAVPFRRLVAPAGQSDDRIFFSNVWFRGHNNPRYAALLPRLRRLDPYLFVCSDRRLLRGLEFRALSATGHARDRVLLAAANRHYRFGFMTALGQVARFRGSVVADVDDPMFTQWEVDLLNRPNVAAYVVTTDEAARRFQELGVTTPHHVISQGVSFDALDPARVAEIAAARPPGVIVGYVAAWLLSAGDRGGSGPLYNIDHLLDMWESIHICQPQAQLWLIGGASERIRRRCQDRRDIVLFGRLSAGESLAHVANFDVAVYPRQVDHAPFPVKIAEFMGLGVPTVSYELENTQILRDTGSGVLVASADEFVDAVERLVVDQPWRARVAASARLAGRSFDWTTLADRYEREILDT